MVAVKPIVTSLSKGTVITACKKPNLVEITIPIVCSPLFVINFVFQITDILLLYYIFLSKNF